MIGLMDVSLTANKNQKILQNSKNQNQNGCKCWFYFYHKINI